MKEFKKEFIYTKTFEVTLQEDEYATNPFKKAPAKIYQLAWTDYVQTWSNCPGAQELAILPSDPGSFEIITGNADDNKIWGKTLEDYTGATFQLKYTPSQAVQKLLEKIDRQYIAELTNNETLQEVEPEVYKCGNYDTWLWSKTWPVTLRNLSLVLLLGCLCIAAIALITPSLVALLSPPMAFAISSTAYICTKSALIAGICLACTGLASGIVAYKNYLAISKATDYTHIHTHLREEDEQSLDNYSDHKETNTSLNNTDSDEDIIIPADQSTVLADANDDFAAFAARIKEAAPKNKKSEFGLFTQPETQDHNPTKEHKESKKTSEQKSKTKTKKGRKQHDKNVDHDDSNQDGKLQKSF